MPQSLAKVCMHIVFSTKYRAAILAEEWRNELFEVLGGTAHRIGCPPLIVGGVADHVHVLLDLGRTTSVSQCVNRLKSNSSLWISEYHPLPEPFHWQDGYGAFAVSEWDVETIRGYILRQEEHHADRPFQDEYRQMLRDNQVAWDEQHVWD